MAEERLAMLADEAQRVRHRHAPGLAPVVLRETLARRIAHGELEEQRDQQARQADDEERDLPRTHIADNRQCEDARVLEQRDHITADEKRDAAANERAERINAHRAAQSRLRKEIREHRVRAGRERRLADTHAHPRNEHVREVLADAGGGGREAP
jgi:hypothetical protein